MLRRSKDPYTDFSRGPSHFEKMVDRLAARADQAQARPCTPGDEVFGPGAEDQKCTEDGGAEAAGSLTEQDILLIHDQARLQHADSPEQLSGLADAWNAAKSMVHENPEGMNDPEQVEAFALGLAKMIEPRNAKGYRRVAVTFGPGKPPALDPQLVPQAMESLFGAYSSQVLSPDEWYQAFQKVHPLEDGNGRLGDLLWKMDHVRRGQEWPGTHPPDFFGTDKSEHTAQVEMTLEDVLEAHDMWQEEAPDDPEAIHRLVDKLWGKKRDADKE